MPNLVQASNVCQYSGWRRGGSHAVREHT